MALLTVIVFGSFSIAQAQWTTDTSTNNIYYNSGNVGIGALPGGPFEVWKQTSPVIYVTRDASSGTGKNQTLAIGIDGAAGRAYVDSTHYSSGGYPLDFRVRGYTYMTVDVGGNVGIGTTSPSYPLHVSRSANDQYLGFFENTQSSPGLARLRVQNTAAQGSFEIDVLDNGNTYFQTGKSSNSPSLSILSGNVGIGTTSPNHRLQVDNAGTGDNNIIDLNQTNGYAGGGRNFLRFSQGAGTPSQNFRIGYDNDTVSLQVRNAADSPVATFANGGYVGIGTATPGQKLDVVGGNINVTASGGVGGNITLTGTINAKYQDVAEWVPSSEQLSAGTVVVLDSTKSNQVTSSSVSYDTRVAGVISEQPGIALGEKSEGKVLVATTGRVRVKVDASKGPIHIGDLLVTSDVPGVAMKSEPVNLGGVQFHRPGTLIGKALEPLEKGKGEILVLLSLQ
jgi:hypothetical protein